MFTQSLNNSDLSFTGIDYAFLTTPDHLAAVDPLCQAISRPATGVTGWPKPRQFRQRRQFERVYQQRRSALGICVGTETRVKSNTIDLQNDAVTTSLHTGGWFVAWDSQHSGGRAATDREILILDMAVLLNVADFEF